VKQNETPAFALDHTLTAYGIRKLPFPIEEVDDFYFATPALAKQSDALRNLVEYSDLILVISGVEGAGKTAFLNQFLLAADSQWRVSRIDAEAATTIGSLVEELLTGFGVTERGEHAPEDEALLRTRLTELHAGGKIAMIVVDDAHLLPQICTEFLVALAEERGLIDLRLLLTTEPGRLGFPTNDPKHVHVVVLQPFDVQQSGDYIHTRLSYAGLVGDSPFDTQAVEEIYQDSGGLPGAIHPLAVHTLLANTVASVPRRRPMLGTRAIAYVTALLIVGAGVAWFLGTQPASVQPVAGGPAGTATGSVRGRIEGLPAQGAEQAGGGSVAAESTETTPFVGSVTPKSAARDGTTTAPRVAAAGGDSETKVSTLDDSSSSLRSAVAVTSPAPAKGVTETGGGEPVVRLASNATPAVSAPAKPSVSLVGAHELDWLRTQDPSHYVIQLVGTRDKAAVARFLDDHRLGAKGAWFVTSHEDKPWYVVVYGMYPDRATARAAIKTLPRALQAGSPWPRSVASVVENAR
jgi:DamX protein